jgi:SAM-dependent methyltransferase
MEVNVDQFKDRARATWAAGNFDEIAQRIPGVGRKLVELSDIGPGMDVLDVACGTGNATIPAAVAGGRCVGVDLTPELFEAARMHAAEAGVEIDWVQGDAEALPFKDESFDRVISTFGVMFAPRHEVAAAELARVVRPGGQIGLACWTPTGLIGEMFKLIGSRMPSPPSYAKPPILWGTEDHVRSLLEPHGLELRFELDVAAWHGKTVEDLVARMETYFGPWKMAQAALGADWPPLRAKLYELYESYSEPADDGIRADGSYLRTFASRNS